MIHSRCWLQVTCCTIIIDGIVIFQKTLRLGNTISSKTNKKPATCNQYLRLFHEQNYNEESVSEMTIFRQLLPRTWI